jgi:hypothetical protein
MSIQPLLWYLQTGLKEDCLVLIALQDSQGVGRAGALPRILEPPIVLLAHCQLPLIPSPRTNGCRIRILHLHCSGWEKIVRGRPRTRTCAVSRPRPNTKRCCRAVTDRTASLPHAPHTASGVGKVVGVTNEDQIFLCRRLAIADRHTPRIIDVAAVLGAWAIASVWIDPAIEQLVAASLRSGAAKTRS